MPATRLYLRTAGLFILFLVAAEGVARVSTPYAPLLPFRGMASYPVLPASAAMAVAFGSARPVWYVTDQTGARIARHGLPVEKTELLVIGDSQALGYDLPFEDTAAVAVSRCAATDRLAISAAPASDPEDYMRRYQDEIRDRPMLKRAIVLVNLGNDLDEIYVSGQWFRGISSNAIQTWLLQHSRAYQNILLWQQDRELMATTIPGVNRILYELSADERLQLTDALATRIAAGIDSRLPTTIAILPNDSDVAPRELAKYQEYAASIPAFQKWLRQAEVFSAQQSALRRLLVARLRTAGVDVLDLSDLFSPQNATAMFARTSHHLTVHANHLIGQRLCQHLGPQR